MSFVPINQFAKKHIYMCPFAAMNYFYCTSLKIKERLQCHASTGLQGSDTFQVGHIRYNVSNHFTSLQLNRNLRWLILYIVNEFVYLKT